MKKTGAGYFTEAMSIALITLIGYLMAYIYEWSALNYYGASVFATATISQILFCILLAIVSTIFYYGLLKFITWAASLSDKKTKSISLLTIEISGLLVFALPGALLLMRGYPYADANRLVLFIVNYFSIVFPFILAIYVWSLFLKKKYKKMNAVERIDQCLADQEKAEQKKKKPQWVIFLEDTNGFLPLLVAFIGLIMLLIFFYLGPAFSAMKKSYGTIIFNNEEMVLIRAYDDRFLFMPLAQLQHVSLERSVTVMTSQALAENNISITLKDIGPLKGRSKAFLKIWPTD